MTTARTARSEVASIGGVEVNTGHWIDGQWVSGTDHMEVTTPIDASTLCEIAHGGAEEVESAVSAASSAFDAWAAESVAVRSGALAAFAEAIGERAEDFATVEAYDTGLPVAMLRKYVRQHITRHITYFVELLAEIGESTISAPGSANRVRYDPSGVCAVLAPWNGPLSVVTSKIGAALAVGNTVVIKPPEWAPLSSNLLAQVAHDSGLPAGVVNVVQGAGNSAGAALVAHPGLARISFTGSPPTARRIAAAAAPNLVPCCFELGGKSPLLVTKQADLQAASQAVAAQYFHAGQICAAGTRVLVERSVAEEFEKLVRTAVASLRVGDPRDISTDVGPLINEVHFNRVSDAVRRAKEEGAIVMWGGQPAATGGWYFEPTMFKDATYTSSIWRTEVFGPVLVWDTFEGDDDAIAKANDSDYGLAAHLWCGSPSRAEKLASRLVAGTVWINASNLILDVSVPFGGARASGVGREGGRWSLEFFAEVKNLASSTAGTASHLLHHS